MTPVGFDLETADADDLFTFGPDFIRLYGTIAGDDISIGTEPDKFLARLEDAPWIYGHNILGFDGLALAFYHGADWEKLSAKAVDTLILSRLDYPPQARDTGGSLDRYDLDHVAERLGVAGKTASLAQLGKKHGGVGSIPLDDPEYHDYLAGDLRASQAVMEKLPRTPYGKREHRLASLAGSMTLSGFRVDTELLQRRLDEGEERKREALEILRDDYDLPLGRIGWRGRGKDKEEFWEDFESPLATLEGRQWLVNVYDAYGVLNPPVTDTGRLSTKADDLAVIAASKSAHPDLRRVLGLMQTVTTTRTVYQTVSDYLVNGRVHAWVSMGQASGRWSITKPGLTVFGKRGGRHHERDIFLPEEGCVLLSCDLSQVDMRAVAGHSQDPEYIRLFTSGADIHEQIAIQMFGTKDRRQDAKAIGHGANYGLGANKLIASGFDPQLVRTFFEGMARRFPALMSWREDVREAGRSGQLLDNGFGRLMRCDPARAYTQAPALMGQGTARDLVCEALLRLPAEFRAYLRVMVHDEIVLSVPAGEAAEVGRAVQEAFTFEWRGVPIISDLSEPGKNWGEVSAK